MDYANPSQVEQKCLEIQKLYKEDCEMAHMKEDLLMQDFIKYLSMLDADSIQQEKLEDIKTVSKMIVHLNLIPKVKYYS